MFYVYHGYVSPDNYDSSYGPTYEITECFTQEDVLELKKKFEEGLNDDCSNAIFRVFEGKEVKLKPVEVVTAWEFEK